MLAHILLIEDKLKDMDVSVILPEVGHDFKRPLWPNRWGGPKSNLEVPNERYGEITYLDPGLFFL